MIKVILGLQILVFVTLGLLGFEYINLKTEISKIKTTTLSNSAGEQSLKPLEVVSVNNGNDELRNYIDGEIAKLSKKIDEKECNSCDTITQVVTQAAPMQKQTSFISMGDTFTSSATGWVDVPGSEVYIDLINDYSVGAYVTWSANLKVAHGNGQAFVRLYDATNNIVPVGSELTTINNVDYKQVVSGQLAFWRGKNLYKVQIKSLNGFEVTYSGGKVKITY